MTNFTVSGRVELDARQAVHGAKATETSLKDVGAAERLLAEIARSTAAAHGVLADQLKRTDEMSVQLAARQRDVAAAEQSATAAAQQAAQAQAAAAEMAAARSRQAAEQQIATARAVAAAHSSIAGAYAGGGANPFGSDAESGSMQALVANQYTAAIRTMAPAIGAATVALKEHKVEQAAVATAMGLTKNQSLALRYTISDIVASLSSGISPGRILMQQGPQLAQAFDSPKQALTALIERLGGWKVAVGAAAGVVALGVSANESYEASIRQIDVAAAAHRGGLGLTKEAWHQLAGEISATAQVSQREGRTIAASLASSNIQSAATIRTLMESARGYAIATGQSVSDAFAEMASKLKDPTKGAQDLAEQFNLLDGRTLDLIRSMQRKGELDEAQKLLATELKDRMVPLTDEVSALGRAFEWAGRMASDFWDGLGRFANGPAGPSLDEQILAKRKALGDINAAAAQQASGTIVGQPGVKLLPGMGMQHDYAAEAVAAAKELVGLELQRAVAASAAGAAKAAADDARQSRDTYAARDRYSPEEARLRELGDAEAMLRKRISDLDARAANPRVDDKGRKAATDELAAAHEALNGVLQKRKETEEQIAKQGRSSDYAEQQRLDKRAAGERTDLQLLEQIYAARATGDEKTARALEGQRDAAKQGFDLTTAMGREMAANAERTLQLQAGLKTLGDIQSRLAHLDSRFTPDALVLTLKANLAAAEQWRDESLANLDQSEAHYQQWADDVDRIFRNQVAQAYEQNLRDATDWASGIKRGLDDLKRQQEDLASTAEHGLKSIDAAGEEAFSNLFKTGKFNLDRLLEAFEDTLAKMVWQKMVQPGFDQGASWLLDLVSGWMGTSSGGSTGGGGGWHEGGTVGRDAPTFTFRQPVALWRGAPKHHDGLDPGEHRAIVKDDEGIFTPRMMRNADTTFLAALNRPIVVDLGKAAGGQWGAGALPKIDMHFYGGEKPSKTSTSMGADGELRIDLFYSGAEQHIAQNVVRGEGPIAAAMERRYGASQRVP